MAITVAALIERFGQIASEAEAVGPDCLAGVVAHLDKVMPSLREKSVMDGSSASLSDSVIAIFSPERWRTKTDDLIAACETQNATVIGIVHAYAQDRVAKLISLADLMCTDDDRPDLVDHLIYWYVEAKSEWYQFNSRVNYQIMKGKEPDLSVMLCGSIGSAILEDLEKLFGRQDIEILTDYLHAPLPNSRELLEKRQNVA